MVRSQPFHSRNWCSFGGDCLIAPCFHQPLINHCCLCRRADSMTRGTGNQRRCLWSYRLPHSGDNNNISPLLYTLIPPAPNRLAGRTLMDSKFVRTHYTHHIFVLHPAPFVNHRITAEGTRATSNPPNQDSAPTACTQDGPARCSKTSSPGQLHMTATESPPADRCHRT